MTNSIDNIIDKSLVLNTEESRKRVVSAVSDGLGSDTFRMFVNAGITTGQFVSYMKDLIVVELLKDTTIKSVDDNPVTKILKNFPKKSTSDQSINLDDDHVLPTKKSYRPRNRTYGTVERLYNRNLYENRSVITMFDTLRQHDTSWTDLKTKIGSTDLEKVFLEMKRYFNGEMTRYGWQGSFLRNGSEYYLKITNTPDWNGEDVPPNSEEYVDN